VLRSREDLIEERTERCITSFLMRTPISQLMIILPPIAPIKHFVIYGIDADDMKGRLSRGSPCWKSALFYKISHHKVGIPC